MNKVFPSSLILILSLAAASIFLTGCMQRFILNSGIPDVVVVAHTPTSSQIPSPGSDAHFVQVDDYFIMEQELAEQSYVYATIAKMLSAAPVAGEEARFLRAMDSQQITTRYFTKTRKAIESDYQLGKAVFFLNYLDQFGNYRAPETSSEARNGWWMKARITDTSETHKGYLNVSGGYNVNLNALRVAVP